MISAMSEAAGEVAAEYPDVMEGIKECRRQGLVVAGFSSQRALMGAKACGVSIQKPQDFDLRTLHFWEVADVLGAEVEEYKPVSVPTGDDLTMEFTAHRAVAKLGIDVEFMLPLGPVCIGGQYFRSTFTEDHARRLTIYETDLGPLPVDDDGTLEIYTLRQRLGRDDDLYKAALVLATTTPDRYDDFMRETARFATGRVARFRRAVATAARQLMNEGVLPVAA